MYEKFALLPHFPLLDVKYPGVKKFLFSSSLKDPMLSSLCLNRKFVLQEICD